MGFFSRLFGAPPAPPPFAGPPLALLAPEEAPRVALDVPPGWTCAVWETLPDDGYVAYGTPTPPERLALWRLTPPPEAYPGWDGHIGFNVQQGHFDLERLADEYLRDEPGARLVERLSDRVVIERTGSDGPYRCVFARKTLDAPDGTHAFFLWLDGHTMRLAGDGMVGVVVRDADVRAVVHAFDTLRLAPR